MASTKVQAAEVDKAVIDARWTAATVKLIRFSNEQSISWGVSKRYDRINDGIEELAALLVDDGVHTDEKDNCEDSLDNLMYDVWNDIEAKLKAWADPERKAARRAAIWAERRAEEAATKGAAA